MSVHSMGSILRTGRSGIKPLGAGGVLSSGFAESQAQKSRGAIPASLTTLNEWGDING